jgi:hypothetical protein
MAEGTRQLRDYLVKAGADQGRVDSMNSALEVGLAWKAMQYDRLVKGKADKVKQLRTMPPVTKPGATPSRDAVKTDKDNELRARLKKTGNLMDAAAVYLNRMK